jgi:hypothetical protein
MHEHTAKRRHGKTRAAMCGVIGCPSWREAQAPGALYRRPCPVPPPLWNERPDVSHGTRLLR